MSDKNSFLEKAIEELSSLTRLEVNTVVGNYTFNKKGDSNTTIRNDNTGERMCSQINLLSGDITTAMTEKFVSEYKELRDYHLERENQGHEIVRKNIEVIRQILSAIVDFSNEKAQPLPPKP